MSMLQQLRAAFVTIAFFTILTGLLYPAVVTGIARLFFPGQAGGSLVKRDGRVVGSALIGQPFDDPHYFWGRLSATLPVPYNAAASAGSNRGQSHPDLLRNAGERAARLRAADPGNAQPVPVDLVTASGSGLDPHISPAAAEYQIPRVARARGLAEEEVRLLVAACTEGRQLGILGEPRVNILLLNLALDEVR
jgi:K+-transporting ATPase ATPase C chain